MKQKKIDELRRQAFMSLMLYGTILIEVDKKTKDAKVLNPSVTNETD